MTKISQRLDLRNAQSLVMTPQLQQAIKLLQMNNMELNEFLEGELAQNPLLEKAEGGAGEEKGAEVSGDGAEAGETTPASDSAPDTMQGDFDGQWEGETPSAAAAGSTDFDAGAAVYGKGGSRSFDDPDSGIESRLVQQKTLREHLLEQLHVDISDPRDRSLGALLIDQLDEAGYLRIDRKELAERLACPIERLGALLDRMKKFDPSGIFARDLAECLALQLEDRGHLDAPMRTLLQNLDKVAARDWRTLCTLCGVNETYMRDMVEEIKALNPRPAADFEHFTVQTVIPDVLMKALPKHVGGGWRVELNAETLPRVLVNQTYYTEVAGVARDKKDVQYLENQMASANWLVRALDQRAQTILKVASEIVEEQNAFFLYGIEFLRPFTLKDIAERTGVHESTVSRVTSNKYIGTPRGIFELKFFFTTAIAGADGISHSAESVRARIKTLIDAEDPKKILSDDTIVDILKKEGVDLARRTVAKYREAMKIPSSVQRRREKKG